MAYVTGRGHVPFDFRLYLPRTWCQNRKRRDPPQPMQVRAGVAGKTAEVAQSSGKRLVPARRDPS
jgi:hypothetical protein